MKIYNYSFATKGSNAIVIVSVRTDEGIDIADEIATYELQQALANNSSTQWHIEELEVEDY